MNKEHYYHTTRDELDVWIDEVFPYQVEIPEWLLAEMDDWLIENAGCFVSLDPREPRPEHCWSYRYKNTWQPMDRHQPIMVLFTNKDTAIQFRLAA